MNLKDLTKELLGKSLNKYYQDTGMSSLDSVNERQDLLLNQLYKDTSIDYVEKTFNDGSTKLIANDNAAIEVVNIKGVTKYKVDGAITDTWKEDCEILGVGDYDKSLDKYKIEILSSGKNLFSDNRWYPLLEGSGNSETQKPNYLDDYKTQKYATIFAQLPKGTYILNSSDFLYLNRISINGEKRAVASLSLPYTFTVDYKQLVGFSIERSSNTTDGTDILLGDNLPNNFNIQIEQSSIQTSYEPYKEDKTQILIDKPLMRLPNGVCDEYVNGKITRRIEKRDYQTGDENNTDVITDKKVTYYELETPIIEDIKIDNPLLMKGFEEGHLSFNTLISPEATIRYKITNKTFEEIEATKSINESVKKTIEQTYPTLMSMDMSLFDLEMKIQDKLQNRIRVK